MFFMALLTRHRSRAIGPVLLAMQIAGVRRSMERENGQRGNVVRIDAVAQRRSVGEAGHQNAGQRAEPDIDHVVVRTASAEGPPGVVAAQADPDGSGWPEASAEWSGRCA